MKIEVKKKIKSTENKEEEEIIKYWKNYAISEYEGCGIDKTENSQKIDVKA